MPGVVFPAADLRSDDAPVVIFPARQVVKVDYAQSNHLRRVLLADHRGERVDGRGGDVGPRPDHVALHQGVTKLCQNAKDTIARADVSSNAAARL